MDLPQNKIASEEALMEYYKLKNYNIQDVEVIIQENGIEKIYKVHTFVMGQKEEIMVLLHGYGGSHAHFCRMYNKLTQHFQVFSIDVPGMGFSSKENMEYLSQTNLQHLDHNSPQAAELRQKTINFFVSVLEGWRMKLGLEKFSLVGHSLGGYIAAQYAASYKKNIKQLFLLSPAGTSKHSEQDKQQARDTKNLAFYQRFAVWVVQRRLSKSSVIEEFKGLFGGVAVKNYLKKRMFLNGQELEIYNTYMVEMMNRELGSERALTILFEVGRVPKIIPRDISIEELIEQNNLQETFPINFYYGSADFMDEDGALRLGRKYRPFVKRKVISKSSHQLNFENPDELTYEMIKDFQQFHYQKDEENKMEESKQQSSIQ